MHYFDVLLTVHFSIFISVIISDIYLRCFSLYIYIYISVFISDIYLRCFSIFISVINQLDAHNVFYNKFISCLYMLRAHVFIIRSELYYTASGIITLKQVSGLKLLKYNSINISITCFSLMTPEAA